MNFECEYYGCPYYAEWIIYPNSLRKSEIAVHFCDDHRDAAIARKGDLYKEANRLIRESLNG